MKSKVSRQYKRPVIYQKKYLQNFIIKGIIVFSTILTLFLFKTINLKPTNLLLNKIRDNISYEFNIKEDGKKVYSKLTNIIDKSLDAIDVFNPKEKYKYPPPITGTIYKEYGQTTVVNNEKVVNNGVDIKSISGEDPKASIDGIVKQVEIRENKGYFVTIEKENIQFVYGYLSRPYVEEGEVISEGELLGTLGTNKDGNKYLRLEIWIDGAPVNPLDFIDI